MPSQGGQRLRNDTASTVGERFGHGQGRVHCEMKLRAGEGDRRMKPVDASQ